MVFVFVVAFQQSQIKKKPLLGQELKQENDQQVVSRVGSAPPAESRDACGTGSSSPLSGGGVGGGETGWQVGRALGSPM